MAKNTQNRTGTLNNLNNIQTSIIAKILNDLNLAFIGKENLERTVENLLVSNNLMDKESSNAIENLKYTWDSDFEKIKEWFKDNGYRFIPSDLIRIHKFILSGADIRGNTQELVELLKPLKNEFDKLNKEEQEVLIKKLDEIEKFFLNNEKLLNDDDLDKIITSENIEEESDRIITQLTNEINLTQEQKNKLKQEFKDLRENYLKFSKNRDVKKDILLALGIVAVAAAIVATTLAIAYVYVPLISAAIAGTALGGVVGSVAAFSGSIAAGGLYIGAQLAPVTAGASLLICGGVGLLAPVSIAVAPLLPAGGLVLGALNSFEESNNLKDDKTFVQRFKESKALDINNLQQMKAYIANEMFRHATVKELSFNIKNFNTEDLKDISIKGLNTDKVRIACESLQSLLDKIFSEGKTLDIKEAESFKTAINDLGSFATSEIFQQIKDKINELPKDQQENHILTKLETILKLSKTLHVDINLNLAPRFEEAKSIIKN
ncbi:MAG: hypothetical protein J0H68_03875 [Sphingobacteriia bacterium]|nr:hypothetical protein [Sphingobacteriia bacterium]